jgi:hypothetical protein
MTLALSPATFALSDVDANPREVVADACTRSLVMLSMHIPARVATPIPVSTKSRLPELIGTPADTDDNAAPSGTMFVLMIMPPVAEADDAGGMDEMPGVTLPADAEADDPVIPTVTCAG